MRITVLVGQHRRSARRGVLSVDRHGLRCRRRWSPVARRIRWDDIVTWWVGRDERPDAPRHTHRFWVRHRGGELELKVRGPSGALLLVRLREVIRSNTRAREWPPPH